MGVVALAGCSADGNESASRDGGSAQSSGEAAGVAKPQQPGAAKSDSASSAGGSGGDSKEQPTVARAIVKTGSLTVEGENVSDLRQKAVSTVTGLGGQVAAEDTVSDADGTIDRSNLTLKVPTKSFETAIQRLSELGKRLQIHQESTDVTEQVVDVGSRIQSQRASLERTRALMTKANTIAEIVSVESELTRRESDLESLLAKQKNLSLQTELATLNLTITQKGKPAPPADEPDKGFVAGLKNGWNAFTATFTVIATVAGALLPFLILLGIIAVPLWIFRGKLRRQPAIATTGPTGPPAPPNSGQ
ncbi:DUF4349 domain-containing protein [Kribbella sp. NPDC048915]|uniref:DUF4349 domain-containing protein n=1 Tax=Kribbella sp. NPDC048915 TaxID=3155148 RepID=UPI0033C6F42A